MAGRPFRPLQLNRLTGCNDNVGFGVCCTLVTDNVGVGKAGGRYVTSIPVFWDRPSNYNRLRVIIFEERSVALVATYSR